MGQAETKTFSVEALREFAGAVRMAPKDAEAHKALHGLRAKMN